MKTNWVIIKNNIAYTLYGDENNMSYHKLVSIDRVEYFLNGLSHRVDGPAVIYFSFATKANEWWVNGQKLDCKSNKEFFKLLKLKAFW